MGFSEKLKKRRNFYTVKLPSDKGIRLQKLDQKCQQHFGCNSFEELCKSMEYSSVDQFFFHCCAPQIKIQKHKTTGKGKTKQGEPVYMEQIHQVHGVTHEFSRITRNS